MRSQRELLPGDEIGGYHLVRLLGTGGTGNVWEVRDAGGCPFALKLLHPQLAVDETYRKRIFREARLLSKVQSEGVVAVCDVEVDSAEPFVVTELVQGPSLKHYVQTQGALALPEALQIASRLLEILESVHAVGVVHRDVKPANILLGPVGPVLIDFGIAQLLSDDRLTATGLVAGTPGWVAPEVVQGKTPDAQADLWGWAATLLYMLTGRSAFGLGTWEAVLSRMALGQVDVAGLPPAVGGVLRQALGPLPQRPHPREVLAFLEDCSRGEATEVVSAGFVGGESVTELLPEGAAELADFATAVLPQPETDSTVAFPPEGTSLQNYQGSTFAEVPGEPAETPEIELFAGYGRPAFPPLSGTLFFLLIGAFPLTFGILGVALSLTLIVGLATIGIHRSFLRSRFLDALEISGRDKAIAWARLPLHLVQACLGVGLAVVISQAAAVLAWYLVGLQMHWDGLLVYVETTLRAESTPVFLQLFTPPSMWIFLFALYVSGLFSVFTVILGPVGRDFTEGTSMLLTRVFQRILLRISFILILGATVFYYLYAAIAPHWSQHL